MNFKNLAAILLVLLTFQLFAAPHSTTRNIKIDQFGYLPNSRKIAVITNPLRGFNITETFSPGTGINNYQLRRWDNDAVVYSGTLAVWKAGITQDQSGDRGWWFDFSTVTEPGSYYIFDVSNQKGSYRFEIGLSVYNEILKQAVRVFYYQRINFAKTTPYADPRWTDNSAFERTAQDRSARSRWDKTNTATAKDLHGGWMDAGDYNKYTTFSFSPLCDLLETYRLCPSVFKDDYGIPESGNGIPDLMDEVKWEIDWLMRMQDATGTGGLYLKVGADNYNAASPPSTDTNPRFYLGECTSSTLTGAAVFALASIAYRQIGTPSMTSYANDLLSRAQAAWTRALSTTSNFNSFETNCDDGDIKAGDADITIGEQKDRAITAAAYLYEATGSMIYRTAFEGLYMMAQPYASWWCGPYYTAVQRALLRYANLPGVTPTVSNNILSMKANQNGILSIDDYTSQTDLYRSHMPDAQYHWGSSQVKADAGVHNWDFVSFKVNPGNADLYKEVAEQYLHWFHGVNPMGKVLLTNMYDFGGDDCANEIYHSWFAHGTTYDNALTSPNGPPPGYVQGGPNKDYGVSQLSPPYNQPVQKSYKDWNTVWNGSFSEDSWQITEPAIYYQGSYISLLARIIANQPLTTLPVYFLDVSARRTSSGNLIAWGIEADEMIDHFEVERSFDKQVFSKVGELLPRPSNQYRFQDFSPDALSRASYYRIKLVKSNGEFLRSTQMYLPLSPETGKIKIAPNPVKDVLSVTIHMEKSEQCQIHLFDGSGSLVLYETFALTPGTTVKFINMKSLLTGIYVIEITSIHERKRQQVFKQ